MEKVTLLTITIFYNMWKSVACDLNICDNSQTIQTIVHMEKKKWHWCTSAIYCLFVRIFLKIT